LLYYLEFSQINLFLFLLFINIGFSQTPTLVIDNVRVNGQLIGNNPIDFGSNSQITVRFRVQFTKPDNLDMGNVSYVVGTNKNSGWSQLFTPEQYNLPGNGTNVGFTDWREYTLYAADYSVNSSNNYLEARVVKISNNLTYTSRILIKRNPRFSLSSNVETTTCNSSQNVTFTLFDENSNYSLNWGYDTSKWQYVSGFLNTITLKPIGSPLSQVCANVTFNGLQWFYCKTVSLSQMPSISINGNSTGCVGNTITYTISGNTTNANINWSISNTSIANFVGTPTNTTATIQIFQNGQFDLNAVASNSCGQTTSAIRNIWIGNPPHMNSLVHSINAPNFVNTDAIVTFSTNAPLIPGTTGYEWHLPGLYETSTLFPQSSPNWHKLIDYSSSSHITVYTGTAKIAGLIQVGYKNACGVGSYLTKYVAHVSPGNNNGNTTGGGHVRSSIVNFEEIQNLNKFVVFPNPSSQVINILPIDKHSTVLELNGELFVDIFDSLGRNVLQNYDLVRNNGIVSINDLKKGLYLVNILDKNYNILSSDKLIIE
jgi:hypothetical protein